MYQSRGLAGTEGLPFNGVKIFAATLFADRDRLGDRVTDWINTHPDNHITDIIVTQSSDAAYHCLSITVFYHSN